MRDSALINNFVECIRNLLITGDEDLGIPPVEPLELEEVHVDIASVSDEVR